MIYKLILNYSLRIMADNKDIAKTNVTAEQNAKTEEDQKKKNWADIADDE